MWYKEAKPSNTFSKNALGGWVRRRCPVAFVTRGHPEAFREGEVLRQFQDFREKFWSKFWISLYILYIFTSPSAQDMEVSQLRETFSPKLPSRMAPGHWGTLLILAYSWARPAVLAASKSRGRMFLFLMFLHILSFPSFFPIPLFHLLYYLFYLFSPLFWEMTQNDPQGLTCG